MARFPAHSFGRSRGGKHRRRLAEARSLDVEQLDWRQMLSANAMVSLAETGSSLAGDVRSMLQKAENVWTSTVGRTATQAASLPRDATAEKVFVALGKGTDTLALPAGVTLGAAKQAERVATHAMWQGSRQPVVGLWGLPKTSPHRWDLERVLKERSAEVREFETGGRVYRTIPGVLAYRTSQLPADSSAWRSSVVRLFGDRSYGRGQDYEWAILEGQPAERIPGQSFHVAYDVSQGTLVILTGFIKVQFENERRDVPDDAALAEKYDLRRTASFPDIGCTTFATLEPKVEDAIRVLEAIRQEAGVRNASMGLDHGAYPAPM